MCLRLGLLSYYTYKLENSRKEILSFEYVYIYMKVCWFYFHSFFFFYLLSRIPNRMMAPKLIVIGLHFFTRSHHQILHLYYLEYISLSPVMSSYPVHNTVGNTDYSTINRLENRKSEKKTQCMPNSIFPRGLFRDSSYHYFT